MSWSLFIKYFPLLGIIAMAIESATSAITTGQAVTTPPLSTYIAGKHGQITISWTPLA